MQPAERIANRRVFLSTAVGACGDLTDLAPGLARECLAHPVASSAPSLISEADSSDATNVGSKQATRDRADGQIPLRDHGQPVLRSNHRTVQPGNVLQRVAPGTVQRARARSDDIHPLFGPDGEELTRGWSVNS